MGAIAVPFEVEGSMHSVLGHVLLGGSCLAIVLLTLRQAAKDADRSKCLEDCVVREDEYCDCGGWPVVPAELTSEDKDDRTSI